MKLIAQATSIAAGVWLMAAPAILDYVDTRADDIHRTVGPLLVAFGIIAVSEVTRELRWANVVLVVFAVVAPFSGGHPAAATVAAAMSAAAVLATHRLSGERQLSQGGGWKGIQSCDATKGSSEAP